MKVVLVSGASTGIGKDACEKLAHRGYQVYAGVRNELDFENLNSLHSNITAVYLDITNANHIDGILKLIDANGTGLDILFNNAGLALGGPLELLPIEDIRYQIEVNVTAQIYLTQKLLPLIRKSNDGRIIFTGSQSGYFTRPFVGPYSATKFALEAICDSWRIELKPFGIKVILLEPGVIKTPIWNKSIKVAKKLREKFDPIASKHYEQILDKIISSAEEIDGSGIPVSVVSNYLIKAIELKNPPCRYRIGMDANINFILSRIMPYRLRDWLIEKMIKRALTTWRRPSENI